MHSFYEFFAGGGMATAGLNKSGDKWECRFANDIDKKKAASYIKNWLPEHAQETVERTDEALNRDADRSAEKIRMVGHLAVGSVADVDTKKHLGDDQVDLAWASFPCQDLSLAGSGAGLSGERSGTFMPFWKLIKTLRDEGRPPRLVVLENVVGALTAGKGQDFVTLGDMLATTEYRFGAVVINADHWVPQSRPRLFIIGVHKDVPLKEELVSETWQFPWHTKTLVAAHQRLIEGSHATRKHDAWVWWNLPNPPSKRTDYQTLSDVVREGNPKGVAWHSPEETTRLIEELMNPVNRKKVRNAEKMSIETNSPIVGTVYKRMRPEGDVIGEDEKGRPIRAKVQRAEVRFDGVAGCLRTPGGGSSRQTILIVDNGVSRSRLLSPRETARLMGLPEDYHLPERYNDAYHLTGDGVVVYVVDFLARSILEPLLAGVAGADKLSA
ncbi:DNA cytosine methyltransferase [Nocardia puris]|uniref:DNA (cytosine-5-)-methyltransferase n=1 Tax=Nocardia puris TaxID=208602 RepID=A0A366CVV1_9NOCA|nr:DNA (cytosine-5-)-methyltransferase [Nocardia puris]RBO79611.1 DNA (cytosine-5)-methyltransferase 1 [Nocardia puris]